MTHKSSSSTNDPFDEFSSEPKIHYPTSSSTLGESGRQVLLQAWSSAGDNSSSTRAPPPPPRKRNPYGGALRLLQGPLSSRLPKTTTSCVSNAKRELEIQLAKTGLVSLLKVNEKEDFAKWPKGDIITAVTTLLGAFVIGNTGLDARVLHAWRELGISLSMDYANELRWIECELALTIADQSDDGAAHERKRKRRFTLSRTLKIGGLAIVGGIALGAGGAVMAPMLGAAAVTCGATITGALLTSHVGIAASAAVFGAWGLHRTAWKMQRRTTDLKEFGFYPGKFPVEEDSTAMAATAVVAAITQQEEFARKEKPIKQEKDQQKLTEQEKLAEEPNDPQLNVMLGISGWLVNEDLNQICEYWGKAFSPCSVNCEPATLVFDRAVLKKYGSFFFDTFVYQGAQNLVPAMMVAGGGAAVGAAVAATTAPGIALGVQDLADSQFEVAKARSKLAGQELARALKAKTFGNRPVSLVGFSFGSSCILYCLETLAAETSNVDLIQGLILDVVLFSTPSRAGPERWGKARGVVAGKFINCYCAKDYSTKMLMRLSYKRSPCAAVEPLNVLGIVDYPVGPTSYDIGKDPDCVAKVLQDVLVNSWAGGGQ